MSFWDNLPPSLSPRDDGGVGKMGRFCQVLVNNLQHLKTREPSPNRQRHDVAPFPLMFFFFSPPSPLSFLPVGALNRIPAVGGWGGFCFVCGVSTSVNKSLVKSSLSPLQSQTYLIYPKEWQNAIFTPKTSGAPRVIYEIFLLRFKLRCGEGGGGLRYRFPPPLCMSLVIHPKKESKKGWMAGRPWVDVLLPARSIESRFPSGLHPQLVPKSQ